MRTEFAPQEAARLAGVLFIASAVLSALSVPLPQPSGINRGAVLLLAAIAAICGGIVYLAPWNRWPARAPLALLPVAFTIIGLGNYFGSVRSYSYSVFFIVAFVWIGVTQPRWTSLAFGPLAAIAYVTPIFLRRENDNADAAAAGLAIPVCILVAEVLAWVIAREQRSRHVAETLAGLASNIAHHLDRSGVCQALVDESKSALGCDQSVLYQMDATTRKLTAVYSAGVERAMHDAIERAALGSVADDIPSALERGDTIFAQDATRGDRRSDIDRARRFNVKSYLAIPVVVDGALVGVLSCWETTRHRRYNRDDLSVAKGFAGQASIAFQNAALYERTLAASRHDALTGLGNRRAFRERLESEVERARRYERDLSLIVLDADRFKAVNDTMGHQAGDRALVRIADQLQRARRSEDGAFRIGGDEFALLLPETGARGATAVAERLRRRIEHSSLGSERDAPLTVSVGVCSFGDHRSNLDDFFARADAALYAVKVAGGNAIALPARATSGANLPLGVDIEAIIDGDHLHPLYQPIFDLSTGKVMGFEALCRLDAHFGPTPTTTLFRAASAVSRLVTLDQLCRSIAISGAQDLLSEALLFVNVSPAAIEAERFNPREIVDVITAHGLSVDEVVIEITEHERTSRSKALMSSLAACNDAGLRLALDDFGAGGRDLDLLAETRFDYVKIDMSFVHGADNVDTRRRMLRGLSLVVAECGAQAIAEGIETPDDLRLVHELHFSAAQGFLLREPRARLDHTPHALRGLGSAQAAITA